MADMSVARAAGASVVHALAVRRADDKGSNANAALFHGTRKLGIRIEPGSKEAELIPELGLDPDRQLGQVAEIDQAEAHRDVGHLEARGQGDRVGAVAVGVLAHERLGHQQLGGEAVGLALAVSLARLGALDVDRAAQHRRAVGVQ